ncbi:hypothetical protein YH65_00100 [Sulfurovum lithotrophicum]|uniref:TIGR04219 family outer membrane beta-barrel protein n=1 Tax=Sulfurovum lithotrophicum TaxID=206403 RepID=A0A7U4LZC8_9BACT|nr:TIGR04219 family outer membrane beta-barrel protein [Sulfurovum lithotrophicum]AKF23987.1 hypothetical protein YH65_00100 [Sulfurovum lithotrophicum]
MIKKFVLASLLASTVLYADMAGGEISIGMYSHSPSGYASYTEPYTGLGLGTSADVEDTLHWDSNENVFLKAYIEHPVPILPNIKLAYTQLSHEGKGEVGDFTWGGINIPTLGTIENNLDISKYDLTLYYELLDNWVEADIGVTLGYIDGNIAVTALTGIGPTSISTTENTDFSFFMPTLYGKARFNIPNTDLSLQFEGDIFSYDDTTYYNYELSARYTFSMGLGIEAGYKAQHLDSSDLIDGLVVDMDFNGPYAAVVWDF